MSILRRQKKTLSPSANVTAKANLPDASQTAVATRWIRGRERARERSSLLRHLPLPSPRHSSLFLSLPTNLLSLSLPLSLRKCCQSQTDSRAGKRVATSSPRWISTAAAWRRASRHLTRTGENRNVMISTWFPSGMLRCIKLS